MPIESFYWGNYGLRACRADFIPLRISMRGFLFGPGPRKNPLHRIIAFVAGVFQYRTRAPRHGNLRGPWLGEASRIVDREFVHHRLRSGPGEPLDQVQFFAGSSEVRLIREISRVDDERIAFP